MVDPVTQHNKQMWERLADAGYVYTRPRGKLPTSSAGLRKMIDSQDALGDLDLRSKEVLVLAGGGGWEPIAFAKLGAKVTLFDISPRQLLTVRKLAERRNISLRYEEGDMKDLSRFRRSSFDVVWHMHSLVFVDDPEKVFDEVARILKKGGLYRTATMHPFGFRMYEGWTGTGWNMRTEYHDPSPITFNDDIWDDGKVKVVAPTIEYGHTTQRIVNGISASGMAITGLWEHSPDVERNPKPGSDAHVEATFPIFLEVRAIKT